MELVGATTSVLNLPAVEIISWFGRNALPILALGFLEGTTRREIFYLGLTTSFTPRCAKSILELTSPNILSIRLEMTYW